MMTWYYGVIYIVHYNRDYFPKVTGMNPNYNELNLTGTYIDEKWATSGKAGPTGG